MKVAQVWHCRKCDVTQEAPLPYTGVFCRKGHAMKLIEGELPVPRKKKK